MTGFAGFGGFARFAGFTTLAAVFILAPVMVGQQPNLGYDDTPMQPEGQWRIHDSRRPRPVVVNPPPMAPAPPPADAIVLVGPGGDLSRWQADNGSAPPWPIANGILQTGKGFLRTRDEYGDMQLHLEFATPSQVSGDSQGRGNSGVFLAGVFEIQVLDSYRNPTYADGQAAALYGQHPPLVNASRGPGEWQSYDIAFKAPRFSGATLLSPATVTVLHNGILVQNAQTFWGPTQHRRIDPYIPSNARGPLRLQDHGNPIRYRNIWLRRLDASG